MSVQLRRCHTTHAWYMDSTNGSAICNLSLVSLLATTLDSAAVAVGRHAKHHVHFCLNIADCNRNHGCAGWCGEMWDSLMGCMEAPASTPLTLQFPIAMPLSLYTMPIVHLPCLVQRHQRPPCLPTLHEPSQQDHRATQPTASCLALGCRSHVATPLQPHGGSGVPGPRLQLQANSAAVKWQHGR